MGSEEATPHCQSTAMKSQPALTPVDSHQPSRCDSKTNAPPIDRLFRNALYWSLSLNASWSERHRKRKIQYEDRRTLCELCESKTQHLSVITNVIKLFLLSYDWFHKTALWCQTRKKQREREQCVSCVWISPLCKRQFISDFASDVWMLVDVSSVSEIVGYLVPGRSFGKQLGLDSVQDVVDYLTLLPCFLLFGCLHTF